MLINKPPAIQVQHYQLLWFRPLSPLQYALPDALARLAWRSTQHLPMDSLQPCDSEMAAFFAPSPHTMAYADTWILSSPTAAHLVADLATRLNRPTVLAVMGKATQTAWRNAGGIEPAHWHISPTGESMGLFDTLKHTSKVLMVRGNTGRNDLIVALRGAGVTVETVAAYQKQDLSHSAAFIAGLGHATPPYALCFTSADQPARLIQSLLKRDSSDRFNLNDKLNALKSCPVFVSHSRIAQAASNAGFTHVCVF
jgi:uroporphyrinogen-III synthase